MEVVFAFPLIFLPLLLPAIAGYVAKQHGRSFWFWFLLSFPLPLISCFILVCLPDKSKQPIPVESQDIFKELNGIV
jgi:hypothetical protein